MDVNDLGQYFTIQDMETWKVVLKKLKRSNLFTYDIETNGLNPFKEDFYIKQIQFSCQFKIAYVLPLFKTQGESFWTENELWEILQDMADLFGDENIGKNGQNVKFDNLCMRVYFGIEVKGTQFDTKLSEYTLLPNESNHLKDMAYRYTKLGGYEQELSTKVQDASGEELEKYGAIDADITHRIYLVHRDLFLEFPKLDFAFHNLLLPASDALCDLEYNGIRINPSILKDLSKKVSKVLKELEIQIKGQDSVKAYEKDNETEFNPKSSQQRGEVLFKYEGLEPLRLTDKTKSPSSDIETLKFYREGNPLCDLLISNSEYSHMKNTFLKQIVTNLTPDLKIHTQYWLTETKSGRSSSSNPNLQNIPTGEKDFVGIRKAFVADKGFELFEFDFAGHELRCMADEAHDENLKKAILTGNPHRETAASVLGIKPEEVTKQQRKDIGKVVNFASIYDIDDYALSKRMKCTQNQAQVYLNNFFRIYYMTKNWMEDTKAFVQKNGYVDIRSGLRKFFPKAPGQLWLTKHELRAAINYPIQGLAGHILLWAMIGVNNLLKGMKSFLSLEVHDSLLTNIYKTELDIVPVIKDVMINYFKPFIPSFEMPLDVEIKRGLNWGEMEEYKI